MPIFITTSAHGPTPICVVASAHELTIQIGDIPNTSTYDLATQIHGAPSAHKPTTQIGRQQKNLNNNGNQDDASLVSTMDIIEGGSKVQIASKMFGVPITSLRNHLYGITHDNRVNEAKLKCYKKKKNLFNM